MDDVDFLPADRADGAEELLDAGARRWLPRWTGPAAVMIAAAIGVGALVAHASHSTPQAPASSAAPSHTAAGAPGPRGHTFTFVEALIAAGGRYGFYALVDGRLSALDPSGTAMATSATVRAAEAGSLLRLAYNPTAAVVWVVPVGNNLAGYLEGYDAASLRLVDRLRLPGVVNDVAILDGRLYLSTGRRSLLRVRTGGHAFETATQLINGNQAHIVADPQRHRLLYLDFRSYPVRVRSWSPASGAGASVVLDYYQADLAVVGDAIWAGGYRANGAALVRLDPATLRPGRNAASPTIFGPGTVIVGHGEHVLYVRNPNLSEPLWCMDGATGAIQEHWAALPGTVASVAGVGTVAPPYGRVRKIRMGHCRG